MSSLIPLSSKPAPRADIDLYFEDTHEIYHNGGYTNILNKFKVVDQKKTTGKRTFEMGIPDYYVATYKLIAEAYLNSEYSNYETSNNSYQAFQGTIVGSGNSNNTTGNLVQWLPGTTDQTINDNKVTAYETYLTQKERDRNVWFQWLYNKFANNNAFSSLEAMNPAVYMVNDTCPYNYNSTSNTLSPKINTLMAQWDAVNANMLYLVSCMRMYKITKVLLKRFADRHLQFSAMISQAISGISTLRFINLLDKLADILEVIPCDNDYIANYAKRIEPSLTGDSYYDPILIPNWSLMIPQYQIQWEGGNPFTPWCGNENYLNETSALSWTEGDLDFQFTNASAGQNTISIPAGYPIVTDSTSDNTYIYLSQSQADEYNSNLNAGWYKTGLTCPYGAKHRYAGFNNNLTAQYLLQQLQAARNGTSFETTAMASINTFREGWLTYLQTLIDQATRLSVMMAPFFSLYILIEKSNLTKYHAKRWEWDIDVSYHYDGWLWDWIKHPEACISSMNNVANQTLNSDAGLLNAHNQYSTGIALRYTHYDEHIVDSNAMYAIAGEWYYCTVQPEYWGFNIFVAPFTDAQANQKTGWLSPDAFDNMNVSYNTYMLPKALIDGLVNVYSYYGDNNVWQVTDADCTKLTTIMSCVPNQSGNTITDAEPSVYPQAWVCVGQYMQTNPSYFFAMQYSLRVFGVIAILQNKLSPGSYGSPSTQAVSSLFTDGYTSYLPITAYNDMPKYYDETVRQHPFTVVTKDNAQKVVQVAE